MNYHMANKINDCSTWQIRFNFAYTNHGATNNNIKLNHLKIDYFAFHNPVNNGFLASRITNNIQD